MGFRSLENGSPFRFEFTTFLIRYNDRIGEVSARLNANREIVEQGGVLGRLRTNIGNAFILGLETYAEFQILERKKKRPSLF